MRVRVPSLNRSFPGKVTRFSVDVMRETRTMHTEVDVPNPYRVLMPGLYAEADISLEHRDSANIRAISPGPMKQVCGRRRRTNGCGTCVI